MNCIDAIYLGDGREVWVIDVDMTIKSYMDNFCLEVGNNPNDKKKIMIESCTK